MLLNSTTTSSSSNCVLCIIIITSSNDDNTQQKIVGMILDIGPSCLEFAMSPCVCVSRWVLWPPPLD